MAHVAQPGLGSQAAGHSKNIPIDVRSIAASGPRLRQVLQGGRCAASKVLRCTRFTTHIMAYLGSYNFSKNEETDVILVFSQMSMLAHSASS